MVRRRALPAGMQMRYDSRVGLAERRRLAGNLRRSLHIGAAASYHAAAGVPIAGSQGQAKIRMTRTSFVLPVIAVAVAIGIFVIDTATPFDVAIAVLYVVVILLAATFLERRGILLVSAGCLVLTVASFLLAHGPTTGPALVRCLMSVSAIAITTFLAVKAQSSATMLREQASLLDVTHDAVLVRDLNDAITYWNRGAEERYGWTRAEAIGRSPHELLQTVFSEPLDAVKAEVVRTGRWEGELVHTTRDGTKVVVESRWALQQDERGRPVAFLETNSDITERKRADEQLRDSERRYRTIFQTIRLSIWEEDFSAVKAAIDDLKAQGVGDFRRYLAEHPEFVRKAIDMVKVVDINDATVELFAARSKEDLLASLDSIFLPETDEVFVEELVAIAEGRTSLEAETVLKTLKGEKLTVLVTLTLPPEPTKLDRVLATIVDITERKRSQEALDRAQAELAHVNRVSTLGELAASIAHEVNQPIAGVVTNADAALNFLAAQPPDLEEIRQALDAIANDGQRAGQILSRIRTLVKKTPPEIGLFDLNQTILEVLALTRGEVQRNSVSLQTRFSSSLPHIPGDRIQVQQVVLNLILNAIEAMSGIDEAQRRLLVSTERNGSDGILVAVRDSGVGLDSNSVAHLFQPFFTTKPSGMGMGLSICRSIIEAHGGRVWASPNSPRGATFQFTLPAHREDAP
jgi:PAS domain S-box-containing protein